MTYDITALTHLPITRGFLEHFLCRFDPNCRSQLAPAIAPRLTWAFYAGRACSGRWNESRGPDQSSQ